MKKRIAFFLLFSVAAVHIGMAAQVESWAGEESTSTYQEEVTVIDKETGEVRKETQTVEAKSKAFYEIQLDKYSAVIAAGTGFQDTDKTYDTKEVMITYFVSTNCRGSGFLPAGKISYERQKESVDGPAEIRYQAPFNCMVVLAAARIGFGTYVKGWGYTYRWVVCPGGEVVVD